MENNLINTYFVAPTKDALDANRVTVEGLVEVLNKTPLLCFNNTAAARVFCVNYPGSIEDLQKALGYDVFDVFIEDSYGVEVQKPLD